MYKNKKSNIEISEKSDNDIIITDADSAEDIIIIDDANSFVAFAKRHKMVFAVFGLVLLGLLSLPFLFRSSDDGIVEPVPIEKNLLRTFKTDKWVLENDMLTLMTQNDNTANIPWDILEDVENILSWSIGLRNLRQDDEVYIVWSIAQYEGEDDIDTKEIAGLLLKSHALDTTLFAVKFAHQGNSVFFDYEGIPWKRQFLRSPVKYAVISSRYDLTRLNPYLKKIKAHRGTDFAAPEGAEVLALADGTITQRTRSKGSGNYIKIKHAKGYATAYLHLSRFRASVKEGDTVGQGDVIGYVGSTGNATGPHVCLRFWRGDGTLQDDFVSAFPYLPKPPPLPFQERERFFERRDSIYSSIMNE